MAHALPDPPAPASDRPELFTTMFWLVTIARVVRGAAVGGTAGFGTASFDSLTAVPWHGLVTGSVIGAIMALAAALANQFIPDGTAPAVVVARFTGRR